MRWIFTERTKSSGEEALVKGRLHLSEREMWHVSDNTQAKEPKPPSGAWVAFDFSQPSILKCRREMESERGWEGCRTHTRRRRDWWCEEGGVGTE